MDVTSGLHPMVCVRTGAVILAEELKLENAPPGRVGAERANTEDLGLAPRPPACRPAHRGRTKHLASLQLAFHLTPGSAALSHSRTGRRRSG